MLVITRREGEEFIICASDDVKTPLGTIKITSIRGDRVRLALEFPENIRIYRREVAEQIIASKGDGAAGGESVIGRIRPASEGTA